MIHIETSYSTLLNKSFAQASKINLYMGKLYRYEIPDEKKAISMETSNQTLSLGNHYRLFYNAVNVCKFKIFKRGRDFLKSVPNFYRAVYKITCTIPLNNI